MPDLDATAQNAPDGLPRAERPRPRQELELEVESLAYGGKGVARLDGYRLRPKMRSRNRNRLMKSR